MWDEEQFRNVYKKLNIKGYILVIYFSTFTNLNVHIT